MSSTINEWEWDSEPCRKRERERDKVGKGELQVRWRVGGKSRRRRRGEGKHGNVDAKYQQMQRWSIKRDWWRCMVSAHAHTHTQSITENTTHTQTTGRLWGFIHVNSCTLTVLTHTASQKQKWEGHRPTGPHACADVCLLSLTHAYTRWQSHCR